MDIKNKAIDDSALNEVSGGANIRGSLGGTVVNGKKVVFNCVSCGKKFGTREELEAHQKDTGHVGSGERYE